MKNGFIKLDREICEHALWKEKPFSPGQAWVSLIFKAKWRDDKEFVRGTLLKLKRGQILTSQSKLSEEWGWNRRTVSRFLKMLKSDDMVHIEVHSSFTVITVCNYVKYQSNGNESAQPDTQHSTQPSTQPDTQLSAHSKESKEYKELKNITKSNSLVPDKSGDDTDSKLKKSEITKGVMEWYIKSDTIYLTNSDYLISMPDKLSILSSILSGKIPNRPDKATKALIMSKPPVEANKSRYSAMLMPYGLAKTFHQRVTQEWDAEVYKDLRMVKVEKSIDVARLMLVSDNRPAEVIKNVMDFMFNEDTFWKTTIRSIEAFRKHFDKICSKMEAKDKKEQDNQPVPAFSINPTNQDNG